VLPESSRRRYRPYTPERGGFHFLPLRSVVMQQHRNFPYFPIVSASGRSRFTAVTAVATLLAGALSLAACGSSSPSSSLASGATAVGTYPLTAKAVTITMATDLDAPVQGTNLYPYQDIWIPAFEKAHPNIHVDVIMDQNSGEDSALYDRIVAAERAHQAPPVDMTDASILQQLVDSNAGVKATTSEVPLLSEVNPTLLQEEQYEAVPFRGSSVVLAYNSQYVKNPPASLNGLLAWVKAHPGKFTYNTPSSGGAGEGIVQAVLNEGIPAADQNTFVTSYKPSLESYWTQGFKTLAALKPDIYRNGTYPDGLTAVFQLLASSAIWMAPTWSDGGTSAIDSHLLPSTIKLEQVSPPMPGGPSDIMVLKGSPDEQASFTFVNYMLTAGEQELVAKYMKGYPGVEPKYAPAQVKEEFGAIENSYAPAWDGQFTDDLASLWQSKVAAAG
jgi:putative spermidine/putrescine transport system substrate-binding protein